MRHNLQLQQGQVSDQILSCMPLNNNPNSTIGLSDFTQSDIKNPLKTLTPPQNTLNIAAAAAAAAMLSTTSGSLFGRPITASSPSSSSHLHPSNNSASPSFENRQQLPPQPDAIAAGSMMSATALLQKAAQMGATASTKMTSMAGTPFGGMINLQKNSSSSNDYQQLQADQSQFLNQFFDQNGGAESEVMQEMGMFSGLFDQNHGLFIKNMEQHHGNRNSNNNNNNNNFFVAKTTNPGLSSSTVSTPRNGKTDTMTVDFLGIGGARPGNFHGQQQQQQQQETFDGMNISHPKMQGFSSFEHHISRGQATMEKTMWEA